MELIPVTVNNLYVPNTSKSQNLARLFVAWMVSEGASIMEDTECAGRVTNESSKTYKMVKETAPNSPILRLKSLDEVENLRRIEQDIATKIYAMAR
jgi:hypothetical protein